MTGPLDGVGKLLAGHGRAWPGPGKSVAGFGRVLADRFKVQYLNQLPVFFYISGRI
jgi:hypothetical protein